MNETGFPQDSGDRALGRLVVRRLPHFAAAWLVMVVTWVVVLVGERRLSAGGAAAVFIVQGIVLGALIAGRVWLSPESVTRVALVGCIVLGASTSAAFVVVGGHADFLAFILLTLYLTSSLFFGWGWQRALVLLGVTVVTWALALPRLVVHVPIVELAGAIIAGSAVSIGIAEGFAREFRRTLRHQRERDAVRARERAALAAAEQARAAAEEATRAKDRLLNIVSHDLRGPIASALTWVELARMEPRDPARAVRALDSIERSLRMSVRLIGDLLDVARIATGKLAVEPTDVDLRTLVASMLDAMRPSAQGQGIALRADLPERSVLVHADADRLRQVFANVLSNAVKFTPRGGRVDVTLRVADVTAELTVSDTGRGIAPVELPRVFEPFRQAERPMAKDGLGLGLAIARYLVEAHGGTITAESEGLDRGTTVRVRLPLASPAASAGSER